MDWLQCVKIIHHAYPSLSQYKQNKKHSPAMLYCPLRISSKVMGVGEAEVKLGRATGAVAGAEHTAAADRIASGGIVGIARVGGAELVGIAVVGVVLAWILGS